MDKLLKKTIRKVIIGSIAGIVFTAGIIINWNTPLSIFSNSSNLFNDGANILNIILSILIVLYVIFLAYSIIAIIMWHKEKPLKYTNRTYDYLDLLTVIPTFFAVVVIVNTFLLSFAKVKGPSMKPTFNEGDTLILTTITNKIERGDVIIVESHKDLENKLWIKRLVGLPGDKIKIENNKLYINSELVIENYVTFSCNPDYSSFCDVNEFILGENEYFILGDNRNESKDSRIIGPITKEEIVGKVLLKIKIFG